MTPSIRAARMIICTSSYRDLYVCDFIIIPQNIVFFSSPSIFFTFLSLLCDEDKDKLKFSFCVCWCELKLKSRFSINFNVQRVFTQKAHILQMHTRGSRKGKIRETIQTNITDSIKVLII